MLGLHPRSTPGVVAVPEGRGPSRLAVAAAALVARPGASHGREREPVGRHLPDDPRKPCGRRCPRRGPSRGSTPSPRSATSGSRYHETRIDLADGLGTPGRHRPSAARHRGRGPVIPCAAERQVLPGSPGRVEWRRAPSADPASLARRRRRKHSTWVAPRWRARGHRPSSASPGQRACSAQAVTPTWAGGTQGLPAARLWLGKGGGVMNSSSTPPDRDPRSEQR
jgi:hypothetical protein